MYMRLLEPDNISQHKVWWLREASQIGQTLIPQCETIRLKHSTAEFKLVQQFLLQLLDTIS